MKSERAEQRWSPFPSTGWRTIAGWTFPDTDRTELAEFSTKAYNSEFLNKIEQVIAAASSGGSA